MNIKDFPTPDITYTNADGVEAKAYSEELVCRFALAAVAGERRACVQFVKTLNYAVASALLNKRGGI